jgi:hypothetical protein
MKIEPLLSDADMGLGPPAAQQPPPPPLPQLGLSPLRRALVNAVLSSGGGASNQQYREVPLGGEL